jgi:hypothetical protein
MESNPGDLYDELAALYEKTTGEALPDTTDLEALIMDAKGRTAQLLVEEDSTEKEEGPIDPKMTRRLSKALSAHLEIVDAEETFKIGDVVRGAPPDGGGLKFEGVAVDVTDETISVDFGDGDAAVVMPRRDVQRVRNGEVLERDDIVQAKPPGTPCFCLGKILSVHNDGTFDIAYEGTDDVDENVEAIYIRKVGSGRSSAMRKFKSAVASITAARAFSKGFGWKPQSPSPVPGDAPAEESK